MKHCWKRVLAVLLALAMAVPSNVLADGRTKGADSGTQTEAAAVPGKTSEAEPSEKGDASKSDDKDPLPSDPEEKGFGDLATVEYEEGGTESFATLQAAIEAAGTEIDGHRLSSKITMVKDVDLSESVVVPSGKTVELNLNGKTIACAGDTALIIKGNAEIKDTSGGGKLSGGYNGIAVDGGTLTFTSGAVESQEFAVLFLKGSTAVINGGTFTAKDNAVLGTNGTTGWGGNTITVNDGTFTGTIQTAGYVACGIYAPNDDVWNVNGGTFNITGGAGIVARAGTVNVTGGVFNTTGNAVGKVGDSRVVVPCAALVFDSEAEYPALTGSSVINVSGGSFTSEVDPVQTVPAKDGRISISGGTYSGKPDDVFFADGYKASGDAAPYGVTTASYVAQIGEGGDRVRYESLAEAYAAVQPGEILGILVAGDYTLPSPLKNITLQGNVEGVVFNHTSGGNIASIPDGITFKKLTFNFGNENYHGFQHAGIINMVNCTINGKLFSYGDISFTGCTFNAPGTEASGISSKDYSMWVYAGDITYTDCTFKGAGKFLNVYNESGATRYTITASGCSFNSTETYKAAFNVKETCGAKTLQYTVNLSNNTINENFPAASETDTLTVISGLVQVDDRVPGGTMDGGEIVVNVDGEQKYITPRIPRVAAIGDVEYVSLTDALNAAQTGNTIVIYPGTVELPATAVIPAGVTLKGQGADATTVKITTTNGNGVKLTNPNITIQDLKIDGSAITSSGYNTIVNVKADGCVIDGVVMRGGGQSTWNSSILVDTINAPATFTVKNSDITGAFRGVLRESCNANLVIENTEIDAIYPFNIDGGNGGTITVSGSKLHGWTSYSGVEKVTFTNCQFSKGNSGYDCVAAYVDTEFNDCTFDGEFDVYAQTSPFNFYFNDCTKAGEAVTRDKFMTQFPDDPDVWNKCNTYVNGELVGAVAKVVSGDQTVEYKSLKEALNAAHEKTGDVTIMLLADIKEVAVIHQKAGLNLTLDGDGKTITGQLYIDGDGRYNDADMLLIKNIKFAYDAATYDDAFIDVPSTKTAGKPYTTGKYNYAHNITVKDCEFAGEGTTTVAVRVASGAGANKVTLDGLMVTGGHSFAQLTGVKDLTITNCAVTGTKNGINISGGEGTGTISGNMLTTTEGYTVRVKDASAMIVTLSDNTFSGGEGFVSAATAGGKIIVTDGKYTGPLPTDGTKFTVTGGVFNELPSLEVCGEGLYPIANPDPATSGEYPYTVGEAVAKVDDVFYANFSDAVAAANNGEKVVTLLADIVEEYLLQSGTLKVAHNGKKLTVNVEEGKVLTVTESEGVTTYTVNEAVAKIGDTLYASLADAVAAVPTDGTATTITMIANEAINVVGSAITIAAGKNVTIDLNGFQVVGTAGQAGTSALITNRGTLTIKDSSAEGTGKLISGATDAWIYDGSGDYAGSYASNTITNSGTLTVESGHIENISTGSATYAIDNNSSGGNAIVTITGGTVKARAVAIRQFANSTTLENSVTISGGLVTAGYSGIWVQLPGSDASKAMKATLNVTGGTLHGDSYAFYDYSYGNSFANTQYTLSGGTFEGIIFSYGANITIEDGTYTGEVAIKQGNAPSNVSVTGGYFNDDVYTYGTYASKEFITGGYFATTTYEYEGETYDCDWMSLLHHDYKYVANEDPATKDDYPFVIAPKDYVAQIDDVRFESLAAAFAAAQDGDTIELLTNCSGDGIVVPEGKFTTGLTVDFKGFTYDFSGKGVGSTGTEYNGFQLLKDNTITFKNGTITATSEDAGFLIQNYSNLTLDKMTIDGTGVWGGYVMSNNCGNVVIKDTTINAAEGDFAFDVCRYASYPSVSVTVEGSSVINGNIEISASGNDANEGFTLAINGGTYNGQTILDASAEAAMEAAPDKVSITKDNTVDVAAPAGYAWRDLGNGRSTIAKAVAKIGDALYASLQDALNAAHEMTGEVTVTLLVDITEVATARQKDGLDLIVDGDGKTITGQINIDGEGRYNGTDTLTIQNAKFAYDASTYNEAFIGVLNKSSGYNYAHNITVKNCEFAGEGTTTVAFRVASGAGANKITLENLTVTGGHSFAQLVGVKDLTITGCTVSGVKNGINISGGDGTGTITGNTIAAEGYTVRVKDASGMTVTLNDNTFSGGEGLVSASTASGKIIVESGKYAGPLPTDGTKFTVLGGVFTVAPLLAVCGDGLYPIANTDPATKDDYPYTVGVAVAAVDNIGYTTFADAVAASENGTKVITLLADIEEPYTLPSGSIQVAHNGKELTVKAPEGYALTVTVNGDVTTYTVEEAVAEIDGVLYPTLQAALDAAHEMTGDVTVKLLKDIEGYSIVHQKAGLNLTIDGADKKIVGQIIIDGDGRANGAETLTIQNVNFEGNKSNFCSTDDGDNGFITVPSTKVSGKPYYTNKYNYAHNITVSNCSFTSTSDSRNVVGFRAGSGAGAYNVALNGVTGTNLHSLAQLTGTTGGSFTNCNITASDSFVNISGGTGEFTFIGNTFESAVSDGYGVRLKDSTGATAIMGEGNSITASKPLVLGKNAEVGNKGTFIVTDGYYAGDISKITTSEDATFQISYGFFDREPDYHFIVEGKAAVQIGEHLWTIGDAVAKIGTRLFGTLEAAVAVAVDGDTIEILKDIEVTSWVEIGKAITIDLAGHTLSRDGNALLNPIGSGAALTLKDTVGGGKVVSGIPAFVEDGAAFILESGILESTGGMGIYADAGSSVTVSGGTISATEDDAYAIYIMGTASLMITDGTISSTGSNAPAIGTSGNTGNNNTITISGGTITSAKDIAIYKPDAGTLTITGGTISGATAVYQKSGTVNINGGTLHATGAAADYSYYGNGAYPTGDALVVETCDYPNGAPVTNISGGRFISDNAAAVASYAMAGYEPLTGFIHGGHFSDNSEKTNVGVPNDKILVQIPEGEEDAGMYELDDAVYVTFDADNKDDDSDITVVKIARNTAVEKPADPTPETGFTFIGWFLPDAETAYDFTTLVTEAITLTARWKTQVIYDVDGEQTALDAILHQATPTVPDPVKENYVFDGWLKQGAQVKGIDPTVEAANIIYLATWKGVTKQIVYSDGLGNILERYDVEYGQPTPAFQGDLSTITREGYEFDPAHPWIPEVEETVTRDVVYVINWTRIKVTVTFNEAGGTDVPDQVLDWGSKASEPTTVREGYTFLGWYGPDDQLFDFENTVIKEDITITARWFENVARINDTYYPTLAEAIAAAQAGDTVVLLKDVQEDELEVGKAITLDLDGHELSSAKAGVLSVTADGDLTITGNGRITGPANGAAFDSNALIYVAGGKLTVENGTLTATGEGSDGMYGVYVLQNGTAIFGTADGNGPTITSHFAAIGTNNTTAPATITVYGGEYTANATPTNDEWWYYFCAPVYAAAAGSFELKGGTFNGYYGISDRYANVDQDVMIWGDVVFNATSGIDVFVDEQTGSAGTADRSIKAEGNTRTLPEGYAWVETEEAGIYTIGEAVASITRDGKTTTYGTLAAAIAAAQDGDTVVLLKNVQEDELVVDKAITLDLNGKEVSATKPDVITVTAAGDLTITGNGKITGPADGAAFDGKVVISVDGGKLTIENGTVTATGEGSDGMYGVYVLNGGTAIFGTEDGNGPTITSHFAAIGTNNTTAPATITVYGGEYTANAAPASSDWWSYFCAPVYAASAGSFNLQGGTFNGYYGISDRYVNVDQDVMIGGNIVLNASSGIQVFVDEQTGSAGTEDRHILAEGNERTIPEGYLWVATETEGIYELLKAVVVTFVTEDGITAPDPQTIGKGTTAEKPEDPVKEGYTFLGWFEENSETAFDFTTPVTEDLTLTARWQVNEYTITFLANEGDETPFATVTAAYGDPVEAPAENPTKPFFTFAGWNPEVPETMPAEDMTIVAKWTAVEGFYLIGSMTNWQVNEDYAFAVNSNESGEYCLATSLAENDQIKVVRAVGGVADNSNYYPSTEHNYNGMTGNYIVDSDHAGSVTVYFRPAGNPDSGWQPFGGYFYIAKDHLATVEVPEGHGTAFLVRDGSQAATVTAPRLMDIAIVYTPAEDYELDRIELWRANGEDGPELIETLSAESFQMPDYDVIVKVYFKALIWEFVDFTWTGDDENGYTAAVANYVCTTDPTKTRTVDADITIKTIESGCEIAGSAEYTAKVTAARSLDGQQHTDTKHVDLSAIGHDWEFTGFTWIQTETGYTAVANYKCKNNAAHTDTVSAVITSETNDPTCEAAGQTVYTATVTTEASLDGKEHTETKTVVLAATGHDWEFVDFTWTGNDTDGYTAVANYKCKNNEEHTKTVNAVITSETDDPTCEAAGQTVYTATVTAEASLDGKEHTETKTVVLAATGHDWEFVDFTWTETETGYTAVANYKCKNVESHTDTVSATVDAVTSEAGCTEAGSIVYTATVAAGASLDGKEHTDTKTVTLPATGHDWEFIDFTWTETETGYTAVANYKCKNVESHIDTVTATVEAVTTEAGCTEAGSIVYTATVAAGASLDGKEHTDTKTVTLPATGHDWEFIDFTWTETETGYTAVANYKCKNVESHIDTVTATVEAVTTEAGCTEPGSIVYTATVTATASLDGKEHTETKTVTLPATGHDWEFIDFTWTETETGYTAVANYKCKNVESHIDTVDATVQAETTKPSCTEPGQTVYTATVTAAASLDGKEHTDTKTVTLPATGHAWFFVEFTWTATDTGYTVVGWYECSNNSTHQISLPATVTAETTPATCTEPDKTVYTATIEADVSLDGQLHTESVTVTGTALGHDWEFVDFTWTQTETGYTAAANYKCKNDASHTNTVDAAVEAEKTDPTCTEPGSIVYTATVAAGASLDGEAHTDTKTVTLPATGHDWEFVDFTWTETETGYTAVANYKCKNDATHTTTQPATTVTCEEDAGGNLTYTAIVSAADSPDGVEHSDTLFIERYTITFVNEDGTVLQSSLVKKGEIPVYEGETPVKEEILFHMYVFSGWDPEITPVTGDATYTAQFDDLLYAKITGMTLALEGKIGINFWLKAPDEAAYAVIDFMGDEVRFELTKADSPYWRASSEQYRLPYSNVAIKQMMDPATIRVYNADDEQIALVHNSLGLLEDASWSFRVADWAYAILEQENATEESVGMAKALINLGNAAQNYFDYEDDDPANPNNYLHAETEAVEPDPALDPVIPADAASVLGYKYVKLNLEGDTEIRIFFDRQVTAKRGNKPLEVIKKGKEGWYVSVPAIAGVDLDVMHTIKVTYGGKTLTFKYSVLSFCNRVMASETSSDEFIYLAKALYVYNRAAEIYFNKVD